MASGRYSASLSLGGVAISASVLRTFDHPNPYEVSLPAGKPVTAWVKSSASIAACNFATGHGYTNGNFDVYWTIAGVNYVRYGVPGTISTDALSLSGGAGDDFPATATTGIVVTKQVTINTQIDGDAISILGIIVESTNVSSVSPAHIDMKSVAPATIAEIDMVANVPKIYDITGGATNIFTGNPIVASYASCGSSSESLTLKILSGEDSTP